MKRSNTVQLTLLAAVAAAIAGCGRGQPPRRCVDANDVVVDDRFCRDNQSYGSTGYVPYHYYYGGPRGSVAPGTHLTGGSSVAPSGVSSGTSRGVIGGAGRAVSGGHVGGGGA